MLLKKKEKENRYILYIAVTMNCPRHSMLLIDNNVLHVLLYIPRM
jgi:hypothetical protein